MVINWDILVHNQWSPILSQAAAAFFHLHCWFTDSHCILGFFLLLVTVKKKNYRNFTETMKEGSERSKTFSFQRPWWHDGAVALQGNQITETALIHLNYHIPISCWDIFNVRINRTTTRRIHSILIQDVAKWRLGAFPMVLLLSLQQQAAWSTEVQSAHWQRAVAINKEIWREQQVSKP